MLICEVINKLVGYMAEYGNIECDLYMEDIDGSNSGIDSVNDISPSFEYVDETETEVKVSSICIAHYNKED